MTIEDDIAFFERVPALGVLGRAPLRILAIGAESRYVHGGEVLFKAGEPADGGFIVQEGRFALVSDEAAAGGDVVTVGPGTLIGELAMLTATTRPVTATAVEPATVLCIPRALLLKTLEGYPEAAKRLRDALAKRVEDWTRDIENIRWAFGGSTQEKSEPDA
jgi:CRP-like cAMP-binding protein